MRRAGEPAAACFFVALYVFGGVWYGHGGAVGRKLVESVRFSLLVTDSFSIFLSSIRSLKISADRFAILTSSIRFKTPFFSHFCPLGQIDCGSRYVLSAQFEFLSLIFLDFSGEMNTFWASYPPEKMSDG